MSGSPTFLAFLDFEKAYDRVNWIFRDEVLFAYSHSSSRLIINGALSEKIVPTRGVRQGCPLSPFLFALYVEPLGQLLRNKAKGDNLCPPCGVLIPATLSGLGGFHIAGSQFADDTTLYGSSLNDIAFLLTLSIQRGVLCGFQFQIERCESACNIICAGTQRRQYSRSRWSSDLTR